MNKKASDANFMQPIFYPLSMEIEIQPTQQWPLLWTGPTGIPTLSFNVFTLW